MARKRKIDDLTVQIFKFKIPDGRDVEMRITPPAEGSDPVIVIDPSGTPGSGTVWGTITGTLVNQTDLSGVLNEKAAANHNHPGIYEPANSNIQAAVSQAHASGSDNQDLSNLVEKITGKGLSANDLTDLLKAAYDAAVLASHSNSQDHTHSNLTTLNAIQEALTTALKAAYDGAVTHAGSAHAPSNAQKNSDITKGEIEAVLTGAITSHSHAGGSSPTSTCKQSAQVTNNSNTTPTDIPGMAFTLVANHRYYFRFMGTYQSAATTTGVGFTFTGPAVTAVNWSVTIQQAAAGTDHNYQNSAVALATVLVSTACIAANTDYMWQVEGFITPSANGTLQLRCRSEVNASQITIQNVGIGILEDAG